MYVKRLCIKNFRGISDLTVCFQPGVNVIVGENNSHKTTVLDALRLCFQQGDQQRSLYLMRDDFHVARDGNRAEDIEFGLHFGGLTDEEKAVFIELLSLGAAGDADELALHVRYSVIAKLGIERIRTRVFGGDSEVPVPQELLELIYFVHLDALRDAKRQLSPNRGNRLGQLFTKLVHDEGKQNSYAEQLNAAIGGCKDWTALMDGARGGINTHLQQTTIVNEPQFVDITFVPLDFRRIVDGLRLIIPFITAVTLDQLPGVDDAKRKEYFQETHTGTLLLKHKHVNTFLGTRSFDDPIEQQIADAFRHNLQRFDVTQNGLGYNNLIYISTVLGDIIERAKAGDGGYIALLIEEPEAHLHPQLQSILFSYFNSHRSTVQIFISSHSPTITSRAEIDSLIVLQSIGGMSKAKSICQLPLCADKKLNRSKRQLERFLDVTRCQLFFAKGIILVEGISEALLLPIFASIMAGGNVQYDLTRNGIEVVNIGGVAFDPFALLFASKNEQERLDARCSIITDDDRKDGTEPCSRAKNIKKREGGSLRVFLAKHTFEYEMYLSNEDMVKALHGSVSSEKDTIEERAREFATKLGARDEKATFAQNLAEHLADNADGFQVPNYLQNAIKWVVDGT